MDSVRPIDFPKLGDDRGGLISLETKKLIPFEIKRVYFIYGTRDGVSRGFHAHKELQQVALCVSGRCRMLFDDGFERESLWLDSPEKGVLIGSLVWREMIDFSSDCVLLVLASEHYKEDDYIRDYEEFLTFVKRDVDK